MKNRFLEIKNIDIPAEVDSQSRNISIDANSLELRDILNNAISSNDLNTVKAVLEHKNFEKEFLNNLNISQVVVDSPEIAVVLIEHGKDVKYNSIRNEEGNFVPLIVYAMDKGLDTLVDMILAKDNLEINNPFFLPDNGANFGTGQVSVLAYAVNKGNVKVTDALLGKENIKLDIDPNSYSSTILDIAIKKKDLELTTKILKHKNFEKEFLNNLNISQVVVDSPEIAVVLIEHGKDVKYNLIRNEEGNFVPLIVYAMDKGLDTLVDMILAKDNLEINNPFFLPDNGANFGTGQVSVLAYAVNKGNVKVTDALLGKENIKLDIDPNSYSSTILDIAIKKKDLELTTKILKHKNFEKEFLNNLNISQVVVDSPEIAVVLIEHGKDVKYNLIRNEEGNFVPLIVYAMDKGLDTLVDMILAKDNLEINKTFYLPDNGANFGTGQVSVLAYAVNKGNVKVTDALLGKENIKLDIDPNSYSSTILDIAIKKKDLELTTKILKHKNFEKEFLNNLNISQVVVDSPEIAVVLIEHGKDVKYNLIRNEEGNFVPLIVYAMDKGLDTLVDMILAKDNLEINKTFYLPDNGANFGTGQVSVLAYAVNKGNVKVTDALLGKENIKLDIDPNSYSSTILDIAIKKKDLGLTTKILKHKNFEKEFLNNLNISQVVVDSPEIAVVLIEKGIALNGGYGNTYTNNKNLIEYAIDQNLHNVIKSLINRDDFTFQDSNVKLLGKYIQSYGNSLPKKLYHKLLSNNKLTEVYELLEQIGFDWATNFDNGDTIMHALFKRADIVSDINNSIVETIINKNDQDNNSLLNVNIRDVQGNRPIDIATSNFVGQDKNKLVKLLRKSGSVEPQNPIKGSASAIEKLILRDNEAPDSIDGNKEKAEIILDLMFKRFSLTDGQITAAIDSFKATKDFKTYNAQWGGQINTVERVIDELSAMLDVQDRLNVSWNFRKVLGTLIHIASNNQEMQEKLTYSLSQIKMCNLSKLIHLLHVGQDKIIVSTEIDYTKKTLDDFKVMLTASFDAIYSVYKDKGSLAIIKWLNDNINKQEITDPEQWNKYTLKVHGIFNHMMTLVENVDNDTTHFVAGLRLTILDPLIDIIKYLNLDTKLASSETIRGWQEAAREGAALLAEEFFEKIISGDSKVSDLEDAAMSYELSFAELEKLSAKSIKHYHYLINQKYGDKQATMFLESLKDCALNNEAKEFITISLESNSTLQAANETVSVLMDSHIMLCDNIDEVRELGSSADVSGDSTFFI